MPKLPLSPHDLPPTPPLHHHIPLSEIFLSIDMLRLIRLASDGFHHFRQTGVDEFDVIFSHHFC